MNRIIILNTPEVPIFGTHLFHVKKLCEGFKWNGIDVIEINTLENLHNIDLNDKDFIYLSNYIINGTEDPLISNFLKSNDLVEKLLNYFFEKKCIPIFWFWHSFIDNPLMDILKGRYILTGEHFRSKPSSLFHSKAWDLQHRIDNYVPSTFSAAIHPDKIGTFARNEKFLSNFVGCSYKTEWLNKLMLRDNESHSIVITPPFISEEKRVNSFLDSVTSLGFHAEANITNNVVIERVFEGLAYGNVVISDNPWCTNMTDGIIEYVNSYESLIDLIHKAWYNKDYRINKQKMGMKWCKQYGTYKSVAYNFIQKADEINVY
jgi:hypothetical protein